MIEQSKPITKEVMAEARRLFSYDPLVGTFIRQVRAGQRGLVGMTAGANDNGYIRIRILGSAFAAHRIAWAWVFGSDPNGFIDHVNGAKGDNRIANLRVVDNSTNLENLKGPRSDNRLGVMGVRIRRSRYESRICVKGRSVHIGTFDTAEAAHAAYLLHKRAMHKGCTI